ncbi:MAG: histidine phosphatase family protein [Mariprofundaceae bacterium]|nr:histidine phosphatase family protein [Mariprofundaceae bacterium]
MHYSLVMPKQLLLIRHAKSDWNNPALSDFDRPLNERGKRDAPMMGARLKNADIRLERLLSSPAQRARSTAENIANAIGFAAQNIDWITELYLASPGSMLDVIQNTPADINSIALVAHNPGISELAATLSDFSIGNIPTCGIVRLQSKSENWNIGSPFTLMDFDYPKKSL